METIEQFKKDLWNGIFFHTRKMMMPSLVFSIINGIVILLVMAGVFSAFLDMDALREVLEKYGKGPSFGDMEEQNNLFKSIFKGMNPGMIFLVVILIYGTIFIISAWFSNAMLLASEDILLKGEANMGDVLRRSMNRDIIKLIGLFVFIGIIAGVLSVVAFTLVYVNLALLFIGGLLVIWIALRFTAAPGAIVHGKLGVFEAMTFSWRNIGMGGAGKIIIVGIVAGIIFMMVSLVATGISALLGTVGGIISLIIQLVIQVVFNAFMYSGYSAAFYRYADVEFQDAEEAHLVEE